MERLSYIIIIQQTYSHWLGLRQEIGTTCWDQVPVTLGGVTDEGLFNLGAGSHYT